MVLLVTFALQIEIILMQVSVYWKVILFQIILTECNYYSISPVATVFLTLLQFVIERKMLETVFVRQRLL